MTDGQVRNLGPGDSIHRAGPGMEVREPKGEGREGRGEVVTDRSLLRGSVSTGTGTGTTLLCLFSVDGVGDMYVQIYLRIFRGLSGRGLSG